MAGRQLYSPPGNYSYAEAVRSPCHSPTRSPSPTDEEEARQLKLAIELSLMEFEVGPSTNLLTTGPTAQTAGKTEEVGKRGERGEVGEVGEKVGERGQVGERAEVGEQDEWGEKSERGKMHQTGTTGKLRGVGGMAWTKQAGELRETGEKAKKGGPMRETGATLDPKTPAIESIDLTGDVFDIRASLPDNVLSRTLSPNAVPPPKSIPLHIKLTKGALAAGSVEVNPPPLTKRKRRGVDRLGLVPYEEEISEEGGK
ncbi:hypothetical protein HK104_007945, partial [Borealophlyctis nickersoniae]